MFKHYSKAKEQYNIIKTSTVRFGGKGYTTRVHTILSDFPVGGKTPYQRRFSKIILFFKGVSLNLEVILTVQILVLRKVWTFCTLGPFTLLIHLNWKMIDSHET